MSKNPDLPLCVDCDGTLLKTDLLHEALFLMVKQAPAFLLLLPLWLLRGKAYLKEQIAAKVSFRWDSLPWSAEVLALTRTAREQGNRVVLATASPKVWADGVAAHLGVFDEVVATQDGVNLSGARKAQRLSELYGEKAFIYVGNGNADLPVWKRARSGIVVSSSQRLLRAARLVTNVEQVIPVEAASVLTYVRALRVHQWLKNLLVLVPLLAAHRFGAPESVVQAMLAFMAFSLCASAVYVINDLLDLEADRQHTRKRHRPFASAVVPLWHASLIVPLLLGLAIWLALMLPWSFRLVLAAYFAMTLVYSLRLKRQVIVDVLLLAALYTVRIIAGAAAIGVVPSFWLLALSMFVFLSLAMVKRYSEMWTSLQQGKHKAEGRGYAVTDLPVLLSLGTSAGMAAVLVLALYLNDPETRTFYPSTHWLWLVPPILLYWISRIWMKCCRGEVHDDPVVFAARDWQSLVALALMALCFVAALTP